MAVSVLVPIRRRIFVPVAVVPDVFEFAAVALVPSAGAIRRQADCQHESYGESGWERASRTPRPLLGIRRVLHDGFTITLIDSRSFIAR